ncbi:hypothetical protein [Luteolibacter sp. Populi]|uniref:hypothetical protein n=1 Tax=Luteolibacter sp. Populi TaxID=3230487 RepID=UPI003467E82F
MTTTLTLEGSPETLHAEVHDGELYLSIRAPHGRVQRVASIDAALGRIFPEYPLVRRLQMAARLTASLAETLEVQSR